MSRGKYPGGKCLGVICPYGKCPGGTCQGGGGRCYILSPTYSKDLICIQSIHGFRILFHARIKVHLARESKDNKKTRKQTKIEFTALLSLGWVVEGLMGGGGGCTTYLKAQETTLPYPIVYIQK